MPCSITLESVKPHEPHGFWGHAPKPPGSASPSFEHGIVFREAELRFLLLFLEKEENLPYSTTLGSIKPHEPHELLLKPLIRLRRVLSMELSSAKRNYAFCFFFWKKKNNWLGLFKW
jgi:hypothetical protein